MICNYVWLDANRNGLPEANEKPIAGAVILLTTPLGVGIKAVTGSDGRYKFDGLAAGVYAVEIQSRSNPTNGPKLRPVTISGDACFEIDFGFDNAGVKGLQIERGADTEPLSFTGSNALVLVAIALVLSGLGGLVVMRRRKLV
jgi:LPXTG-motif cell wall-anchored protein